MKMRHSIVFLLLAMLCSTLSAQDSSKTQTTAKKEELTLAVTPLRVQVVFTEFDGEKKVSSLPYTLSVNADERRANPTSQIRNGARIPIQTDKDKFTYLDIGTNIDCSAVQQDDGRFKSKRHVLGYHFIRSCMNGFGFSAFS